MNQTHECDIGWRPNLSLRSWLTPTSNQVEQWPTPKTKTSAVADIWPHNFDTNWLRKPQHRHWQPLLKSTRDVLCYQSTAFCGTQYCIDDDALWYHNIVLWAQKMLRCENTKYVHIHVFASRPCWYFNASSHGMLSNVWYQHIRFVGWFQRTNSWILTQITSPDIHPLLCSRPSVWSDLQAKCNNPSFRKKLAWAWAGRVHTNPQNNKR